MENLRQRKNRNHVLILLGMALLVLLTRLLTLQHGMDLHPDEWIFTQSATSTVRPDYTFKVVKNYPNGAFLFQMPFHFVAYALSLSGITTLSDVVVGRMASVFYFLCGGLLGAQIVYRLTHKNLKAVVFYALLMVFSLFQIEQSRYGTGDPISFFLLMVVLSLLDIYAGEHNNFYLYFASLCVGALAATKFPLYLFIALPLGRLFLVQQTKSRVQEVCGCLLFSLAGLLLFSPQFFSDPSFFMRTFFTEFDAYVGEVQRNPLSHLLSLLVFHMGYADVLLGPVVAGLGVFWLRKRHPHHAPFYTLVLPLTMCFFFVMNLFTKWLAFRAYYQYFSLMLLYTAVGLTALWEGGRLRRWLAAGLVAFLVVRGSMFTALFSQPPSYADLGNTLAADADWSRRPTTICFGPLPAPTHVMRSVPEKTFTYVRIATPENVPALLQPGEYGVAINPFPSALSHQFDGSQLSINRQMSALPEYIGRTGSLFDHFFYGAWVPGSTLMNYEMPLLYLYHVQDDRAIPYSEERRALYDQLYYTWDADDYVRLLSSLEGTLLVGVYQGAANTSLESALHFPLPEGTSLFVLENQSDGYVTLLEAQGEEPQRSYPSGGAHGGDFELSASTGGKSTLFFRERDYASGRDGLSLAVYDEQEDAMLDWVYLYTDESGSLLMERY